MAASLTGLDELPPARQAELTQLLAEVSLVDHREFEPDPQHKLPRWSRCWVCGKAGKTGGHHLKDGTVVPVHRRCHRKLHPKNVGRSA